MVPKASTPHVARVRSSALSSSSAGSGLLQLVQSVVRQQMKVPATAAEDKSEEEEEGEREVGELKRAKMTLPTLESWYNNQYPKGRSTYYVRPPSFLAFGIKTKFEIHCGRHVWMVPLGGRGQQEVRQEGAFEDTAARRHRGGL